MKMISKTLLIGMLPVIGGFVLAQENASPTKSIKPGPSATKNTSVSDFPIIGHIEKRDRIITIKAGPESTVYSVKSADGKILCNNLTLEQLRAQSPELHEFVKTAVAGDLSNGVTADSRIRVKKQAAGTADSRIR